MDVPVSNKTKIVRAYPEKIDVRIVNVCTLSRTL